MYCYVLYNDSNNKTYNGFTTDLYRRIRQHNSEIKGGAKYTTSQSKHGIVWKYLMIIECAQFTLSNALSLEWHIKYPTKKRTWPRPKEYLGAHGRIRSLPLVFQDDKFKDMMYMVNVDPCFYEETKKIVHDLCPNATVIEMLQEGPHLHRLSTT